MENEVEEENKTEKHKLIAKTPDWLDLPEPIATNIILEHLDIVDYIQFSAVCKRWQSIQQDHRIRYSPYPPPSRPSFPWLICNQLSNEKKSIHFYVSKKCKTYNITPYGTPKIDYTMNCGYGWLLLLLDVDENFELAYIFNPITSVQIKLAQLPVYQHFWRSVYTAQISSPPTDPDCTILIKYKHNCLYLYRLNEESGLKRIDYSNRRIGRTILCHNKMYNVTMSEIGMVDTLLPDPVEHVIKMDCSEICTSLRWERFDVVDFLGDLVMVILEYHHSEPNECDLITQIPDRHTIIKFYIYKADFSTSKWVRMETLGDHALFISRDSIFSLPVVDAGYQKNTIYCTEGFMGRGLAWRGFDLRTDDWIDGPSIPLSCKNGPWSWFIPTLDCLNVAKTNENG